MADAHSAIVFVAGDVFFHERPDEARIIQAFSQLVDEVARAARDEQMPVVVLGRPGLFGSTGDHRNRHREMEYGLVGRAIEQLGRRLELRRVALVGQSGGASVIMGALSLGTRVGDCIVAASGAYEIAELSARKYASMGTPVGHEQKREWSVGFFNHHRSLTDISRTMIRRIFLIGDPADPFAPFSQQRGYARSLDAAGYRVGLVEAKSPRGDGHTFIYGPLRAAAHCLRDEDDARIVQAVGGVFRTP